MLWKSISWRFSCSEKRSGHHPPLPRTGGLIRKWVFFAASGKAAGSRNPTDSGNRIRRFGDPRTLVRGTLAARVCIRGLSWASTSGGALACTGTWTKFVGCAGPGGGGEMTLKLRSGFGGAWETDNKENTRKLFNGCAGAKEVGRGNGEGVFPFPFFVLHSCP